MKKFMLISLLTLSATAAMAHNYTWHVNVNCQGSGNQYTCSRTMFSPNTQYLKISPFHAVNFIVQCNGGKQHVNTIKTTSSSLPGITCGYINASKPNAKTLSCGDLSLTSSARVSLQSVTCGPNQ